MTSTTGQFELPAGKAAGAKLFWRKWLPIQPARAVILLVHGYAEHSGRYEHVAEHCIGLGYAVYALDHWGHGQSEGVGGDIPSFSVLLDGVDAFFEIIRSEQPNLPMVLLGHSMGGLIATHYLSKHQDRFIAAVLSGPALAVAEPPSAIVRTVASVLSKIAPRTGVMPPLADGVSRDPSVVNAYKADPLVYHGKVGARMGYEMMRAMEEIEPAAPTIRLPILIMHGDQDVLTAVSGSQMFAGKVGSEDKKLVLYPGLHHEIFNEPEQKQVLADMTDWLEERIA